MKSNKSKVVKQKVVVTVGEDDASTIILYRGGKTGLAFRSPDHRVFREGAHPRLGGSAATSAAPASAAVTTQQGGSR